MCFAAHYKNDPKLITLISYLESARSNLQLTMKMVAVLHWFSIVHLLCLFPSQNKCTRYWPDPDTTKDISTFHVRYLKEFEYSDYTLREFELTSETNVSVTFTIVYYIVHCFFEHCCTHPCFEHWSTKLHWKCTRG